MTGDEFTERAIRRIYRFLAALAALGAAAALATRGWRDAAGFLVGAAASAALFTALHKAAFAIGPGVEMPSKGRLAWLAGFRYLLVGAGVHGMMRVLDIDASAILAGLLVMAAAIVLEILHQLFHART